MSDAALPLLFLLAASHGDLPTFGGAAAAKRKKKKKGKAPAWPTPQSPPPPMPAFRARRSSPPKPALPSADPSRSSTPLAELHNRPPEPTPIEKAKQAATAAIRQRTTNLLKAQAASLSFNPFGKKAAPTSTALVANLQKILGRHGVKVVQDGLYGPKTAGAWQALAKKKGLAPTIAREGPKIAKVDSHTFEMLSMAPIP